MPPIRSKAQLTPIEYIKDHGYKVATVMSVWSAGESDLGGETYLFIDDKGDPYTAVEIGDRFVVHKSWDQFNPVYCYD